MCSDGSLTCACNEGVPVQAPDSVYTVSSPYGEKRSCGPDDHDSLDYLAYIGVVRSRFRGRGPSWHMGV